MSSEHSPNNPARGKRYTNAQKTQVLAYVDKVNDEQGRGGVTAASKKYGVTPLSISNWLKRKRINDQTAMMSNADYAVKLRELADLHEVIVRKEEELQDLRDQYHNVKSELS